MSVKSKPGTGAQAAGSKVCETKRSVVTRGTLGEATDKPVATEAPTIEARATPASLSVPAPTVGAMPIPEFIVDLRRHVGHAPLWLIGCTAVVVRDRPPTIDRQDAMDDGQDPVQEVLLVRRADTGVWSPVTGIVDPGEDPHVAAIREVWEEAAVRAEVTSLVWVSAGDLVSHVNGDQARYLDHTFRCRYLEGDPRLGDDENVEVGWFAVDELPDLPPMFAQRIAVALADPPRPILGKGDEPPTARGGSSR